MGLEDRHRESRVGEFLGGGQPGGTGADDRHLPSRSRLAGEQHRLFLAVHDEPLDVADRQRLVEVGADAGVLAQVVADPAEDGRQRVVLTGQSHGLEEVAVADGVHVLGNLLIHRALVDTRCLDAIEVLELPGRFRSIGAERGLLVPPVGAN